MFPPAPPAANTARRHRPPTLLGNTAPGPRKCAPGAVSTTTKLQHNTPGRDRRRPNRDPAPRRVPRSITRPADLQAARTGCRTVEPRARQGSDAGSGDEADMFRVRMFRVRHRASCIVRLVRPDDWSLTRRFAVGLSTPEQASDGRRPAGTRRRKANRPPRSTVFLGSIAFIRRRGPIATRIITAASSFLSQRPVVTGRVRVGVPVPGAVRAVVTTQRGEPAVLLGRRDVNVIQARSRPGASQTPRPPSHRPGDGGQETRDPGKRISGNDRPGHGWGLLGWRSGGEGPLHGGRF
jgi:hypothetical protein